MFQLIYSNTLEKDLLISTDFIHLIILGIRMSLQVFIFFGVARTLSLSMMVLFAFGAKVLLFCASQIRQKSAVSSILSIINPALFMKSIKAYIGFYILVEMISNTIITNMASAGLTSAFLMEIMTVFVIILVRLVLCSSSRVHICNYISNCDSSGDSCSPPWRSGFVWTHKNYHTTVETSD